MLNVLSWFQTNWMEAIMLVATLAAVVASILAVRISILALGVAKQAVQSADNAHERDVRLQARSALADARGSYEKLASACEHNMQKWREHDLRYGPKLRARPFALSKEAQETLDIRKQGAEVLRLVDAKFQTIDRMSPDDLEDGIPEVRQAAAAIDALVRRIQEPKGTFH